MARIEVRVIEDPPINVRSAQEDSPDVQVFGDQIPGLDGAGITSITMNPDYTLTIEYGDPLKTYTTPQIRGVQGEPGSPGKDGQDGEPGTDGVGIASIAKTATVGLVDTYTVTFTDGNSTTFTVTNGQNGTDGAPGPNEVTGKTATDIDGVLYGYKGEISGIPIDSVPTNKSENLVESGGVYSAVSAKYTKPVSGIPKSDLASGVQTSLGLADTAVQPSDLDFVVNLTPTALDYSGVMDKTVAEINTAAQAHKRIIFRVWTALDDYVDVVATMIWNDGDDIYPSFNAFIIDDTSGSIIYAYTGSTNDGTKAVYGTIIYNINLTDYTTYTDVQYILANGTAKKSAGIFYAAVDGTSTSTAFTVQIPGVTEYYDGLTVMLYNGVVTSASGYTIDINGLGAYGTYSNMAMGNSVTPTAPTRDTTIFNLNYAMLMVFCSDIGGSGTSGWICYRGYDANTNTIGYQVRTNSYSLPMTSVTYRYRLLFESADHAHWVPATNSTSTNATSSRTVCQDKIDPFGKVVYYGTTASVAAGSRPSVTNLWQIYAFNLGYSFQKSTNYSLTSWKPVYLVLNPQTDGSAIIDSTTPITQTLPSTADGKLYKHLGVAYSSTNIELSEDHQVFYHDGTRVRPYYDLPTYNGGVS